LKTLLRFASLSVICLLSIPCALCQTTHPNEQTIDAQIDRVIHGLVPLVVIKGQPSAPMNLDDRLKYYHVPGVSIAYFDRGEIVWARGYGLADVAANKPVTPDTLFQAASISKPVSALAALRLVEEGKLNLNEDVNTKLREWKVPENEFTKEQKVTVRRILSHTAGLTVHGFPGYAVSEPLPTLNQILNGEKPANTAAIRVDTVPGTNWRYSGGGYVILQLLLTEVTGESYPKLMHDLVLGPAQMAHSTYEQPLPETLRARAADAYDGDGHPVQGLWHIYPEMAPAGLWTTSSDLAHMAIEVEKEYAGKSHAILSQQMVHQMLTPEKNDYGLGFGLDHPGSSSLRFGHGGSNDGFEADFQAYADGGPGFAIMTNGDRGQSLIAEIERSIAKEYGWPDFHQVERTLVKIDPAILPTYVGSYQINPHLKLIVTLDNNKLYMQVPPFDPDPLELFPESPTEFFNLSNEAEFEFHKGPDGSIDAITFHQRAHNEEWKKIK
jgi:CubicO group peptidase (beta-lactamase class C family)